MRILIDECAPRDLKLSLAAHHCECSTVQELGWSGKKNGELLALAEGKFEVLVTLDKNIQLLRTLQHLLHLQKYLQKHLLGELARLGVLLRRMIRAQQNASVGHFIIGAMGERNLRF